jgi:hypothetical protein
VSEGADRRVRSDHLVGSDPAVYASQLPMANQLALFNGPPSVPGRTSRIGPARLNGEIAALAGAVPDGIHLGTSSWAFTGWTGIVYDRPAPENLLAREGLTAYARHPLLRAVRGALVTR